MKYLEIYIASIVGVALVCATDAGREGELIFRFVYEKAGCEKPFSRLWISSMEESAIKQGFEDLRDGHDYDPLYHSALCRCRFKSAVPDTHHIIFFLFKILYGVVPFHKQGKGRCLYPPHVQGVVVEDGEKAGRIDTDKPISLCPASRNTERRYFYAVSNRRKAECCYEYSRCNREWGTGGVSSPCRPCPGFCVIIFSKGLSVNHVIRCPPYLPQIQFIDF